jgi:hypothetical protein
MILNLPMDINVARKECVEKNVSGVTSEVSPVNGIPTLPESRDDDSARKSSTPWIKVDRRGGHSFSKQVKGKQSVQKAHSVYLTKVVN